MGQLSALEPNDVFCYFERLCSLPHGSGNTRQISNLCVSMAKELGLRWRQEPCNNVIIWKDGSVGYENSEPIILQGHMDMVCVKTEDCTKDLAKDGLDVETDGTWVWAKNTSLGGDDCIAIAMIYAVLADNTLPHPPIEVLITVDEETEMGGAFAADMSDLRGKMLLNLDSEEEGVFTVSCAGGIRADCFLPGKALPLCGEAQYLVRLSGLLGGHSGAEIHKGRANANVLMGRVLFSVMEQIPDLRLCDIYGGSFHNVICPFNEALVAVPIEKSVLFESVLCGLDVVLKNEYAGCDDGISLTFEKAKFGSAMDNATTSRILHALIALPQGVQAMNANFPGLVQTSLNLGVMRMEEDGLHFALSIRSCIDSQKLMILQRIHAIMELAGGTVRENGAYPGWQYKQNSILCERVMDAYRTVSKKEGIISATHGGLECGLFIEKKPGLDAVSIGPELHDVHSVNERLNVASTKRTYALLCEILRRCK